MASAPLDLADIQGNIIRAYKLPYARYLYLAVAEPRRARALLAELADWVTTAEWWPSSKHKPRQTLNLAFTHPGLAALGIAPRSLKGFPEAFANGMRARAELLSDVGANAPEHWEAPWDDATRPVHILVILHAQDERALAEQDAWLAERLSAHGGVIERGRQDGHAIHGEYPHQEPFGFKDGIGQPDIDVPGLEARPGRGKPTADGGWAPLARGEFLLGHRDEAKEVPGAPLPPGLARNGTYLAFRKLHQKVYAFRRYLHDAGAAYPYGAEGVGARMVGRWRDGSPVQASPDAPDPELGADPQRNDDFRYPEQPGPESDTGGALRCPLGAHIRRANPRTGLGFQGSLVNRHRIMRRGVPYGGYIPWGEERPDHDDQDRGLIFVALGASLERQFEFVQRLWMNYGNPFGQGNDADALIAPHDAPTSSGKTVLQGEPGTNHPPKPCFALPRFVTTRGGDYFFMPGMAGLRLIAAGTVDPA